VQRIDLTRKIQPGCGDAVRWRAAVRHFLDED